MWCRIISLSFVLIVALCSSAIADEPYQKWMDFFEGSWTAEPATGQKEEVTFSYVEGKYAMIGKRSGGKAATQLVGWQPDRKVMVDTYYQAGGDYSVVEYDNIGDDSMTGQFKTLLIEGADFAGAKVLVTKVDSNTATVRITKGGDLDLRITYRRNKQR